MLADPLDAADGFLNRPIGCIAVSLSASVFSGLLWFVDKHVMKARLTGSNSRRSKKLQRVREYEAVAVRGCLKLLWAVAGILAVTYLGRAFLLK